MVELAALVDLVPLLSVHSFSGHQSSLGSHGSFEARLRHFSVGFDHNFGKRRVDEFLGAELLIVDPDCQFACARLQFTDRESVIVALLGCGFVRKLNVLVEHMVRVALNENGACVVVISDSNTNAEISLSFLGPKVDLELLDVRLDVEMEPETLSLVVVFVADLGAINTAEPLRSFGLVWQHFHVHRGQEVLALLQRDLA